MSNRSPRKSKLTISLSREEMADVCEKISRAGMSRSEAGRLLLLGASLPEMQRVGLDPSAVEAYRALAPLQSNLNQIAAAMNQLRPTTLPTRDLLAIQKNVSSTYKLVARLRQELITTGARP